MKFLEQLRIRAQRLLMGRYGSDEFNLFILSIAIILTLLTLFIDFGIFSSLITLVLLSFAYFRIFSKNFPKRRSENQLFLRYFTPIKTRLLKYMGRVKYLRSHKYLKCTECTQSLRVPRGKGKICVTCPKCKHEIHTKS